MNLPPPTKPGSWLRNPDDYNMYCMYIMFRFLGLRIPDYKLAFFANLWTLRLGGRSNPEIGFRCGMDLIKVDVPLDVVFQG